MRADKLRAIVCGGILVCTMASPALLYVQEQEKDQSDKAADKSPATPPPTNSSDANTNPTPHQLLKVPITTLAPGDVDIRPKLHLPLSGKTDLIPGQINTTWILADRPGTFRGQCTEYCGLQHAHMGFEVVASSNADFETWRQNQLKGASDEALSNEGGQRAFQQKCGVCHTVRGTTAGGRVGPDLTHLMSRATIVAATLPNKPGFLSGWIADPQHVKPGSKMPKLQISGNELAAIRDYLQKLN